MDNTYKLYGRCHMLTDWDDWNYDVHCDEAQIIRQGRSLHYPFTFIIDDETQSAKFSSSSDLPYYDTTLRSCTCYDFQERQLPCKHIYRLAVELGVVEIVKRTSHHSTYDKERLDAIRNSNDIDNDPEQVKRQKSSIKCTPLEIDFENETAVFKGSGKSPYTTTTTTCTCRDYFVRRLPCKHIYRLLTELGYFPAHSE